jgi:glyoxylase-like metal-dependent hydrolase (beta-lactamase superfamily II)
MKPLWATVLASAQLLAFEYGLTPSKVNDSVYCYFGKPEVMDTKNNGNMVNSCFVDTGKSWLVVDSGPSYMYAKEALLHVNSIKKMPVKFVINTHVHDDHWLGNNFYATQGATVVGSFVFKTHFHPGETPRMAHRISPTAYAGTVPTIPERLISEDETLHVGNLEVKLINVDDKAHTQRDLLVYIPKIKTLFAGDLIFNERLPSLRDGDIKGWIKALDAIKAMNLDTIIGGHGIVTSSASVEMTYNYLTELRDGIREAIAADRGIEETLQTLTMKKYKDVGLYDIMHRQNVEVAYRMLEWEDE